MSCFLWHRQHQTLPLRALVLGFWVVLKNWCLITSDYLLSKSGSFWRCSMMPWHISMHCSFWSSYSSCGTIFAQTFQMPKSLVIIFQTLSFFMSSRLAVIQTINQRLLQTICFTHSAFTSVLLVEGLPLLESSSTSLCPSLNLFCHSKKMCSWRYIISKHLLKHFKC